MNAIIERGKAHYKGLEALRIEVPEWGDAGRPLVITWKPLTMRIKRAIYKSDFGGKPADGATINVRAVAQCALDEDGKRMFPEPEAEFELMNNVSAEIVQRIAGAILFDIEGEPGETAEDRQELEKNG